MTRFERVKEILDASVANQVIGAHGAFWRPLDLTAFKGKKVYGKLLVIPGQGAVSNIVLAMRGQAPFGEDIATPEATFPRMPARMPPVPEIDILFIETWINDGCPDDDVIEQA